MLTDAAVRLIYAYLPMPRSGAEKRRFSPSCRTRLWGQRLKTRSLREIVKRAMRRAGFDDDRLTTHSLRHTAVTLALLGGATLQQAQSMARHTNSNTTLVYSHNLDRVSQAGEFAVDRMLD